MLTSWDQRVRELMSSGNRAWDLVSPQTPLPPPPGAGLFGEDKRAGRCVREIEGARPDGWVSLCAAGGWAEGQHPSLSPAGGRAWRPRRR